LGLKVYTRTSVISDPFATGIPEACSPGFDEIGVCASAGSKGVSCSCEVGSVTAVSPTFSSVVVGGIEDSSEFEADDEGFFPLGLARLAPLQRFRLHFRLVWLAVPKVLLNSKLMMKGFLALARLAPLQRFRLHFRLL